MIREERIAPIFSDLTETRPALKHGGCSATTILPGEDSTAFKKLHRELIAELTPEGILERDAVDTLARLGASKISRRFAWLDPAALEPHERKAVIQAAEAQARKELGEAYELVEIGETVTVERLLRDLGVEDRLDATIDKCLKRLLFLRIPGPTRAA